MTTTAMPAVPPPVLVQQHGPVAPPVPAPSLPKPDGTLIYTIVKGANVWPDRLWPAKPNPRRS